MGIIFCKIILIGMIEDLKWNHLLRFLYMGVSRRHIGFEKISALSLNVKTKGGQKVKERRKGERGCHRSGSGPHRKHYRGHYRSNQRTMEWRRGIVSAIYVIYRGLINRLMKQ